MPLENPELAEFIVQEAHANQRKTLLAIGGWSYNDAQAYTDAVLGAVDWINVMAYDSD